MPTEPLDRPVPSEPPDGVISPEIADPPAASAIESRPLAPAATDPAVAPQRAPQPAPVVDELAFDDEDLDELDALAEGSLGRRAKTLACTVPLHELEQVKGSVRGGAFARYTLWDLAFVAIDTVTVHMDFERGADEQLVVSKMLPYARAQAPGASEDEHQAVCKWVLDRLIGVGEDRRFVVSYGDYDGGYVARDYPFNLIREAPGRDGIFLRATDEAINVIVGALDRDIESAQAAAEAKLDNLVRRNRLSEARTAAEEARLRTVQYAESIRLKLAATERDLRSVDWAVLSEQLSEALVHVGERTEMEQRILVHLTRTRENAEEPGLRRKATIVIDLLRDCLRRHRQLHRVLHTAREVFLDEQDRQAFVEPAAADVRSYDLHEDLLVPLMTATLAGSDRPLSRFASAAGGLGCVRIGALDSIVESLLAPARERDELGEELVEAELQDTTLPPRFDDSEHELVGRLLEAVGPETVRLSALLQGVEDRRLAHLLVLHAGFAFTAPLAKAGPTADLVAWSDEVLLPAALTERLGVRGSDLLLVRLEGR
jgi:hypothetical protein